MEPLRKHRGMVAPLYRENIDTDQIIPKQHLKALAATCSPTGATSPMDRPAKSSSSIVTRITARAFSLPARTLAVDRRASMLPGRSGSSGFKQLLPPHLQISFATMQATTACC